MRIQLTPVSHILEITLHFFFFKWHYLPHFSHTTTCMHKHTYRVGEAPLHSRLCCKLGCEIPSMAERLLKRGCLLNHRFQLDASLTLWLFLTLPLGPCCTSTQENILVCFMPSPTLLVTLTLIRLKGLLRQAR